MAALFTRLTMNGRTVTKRAGMAKYIMPAPPFGILVEARNCLFKTGQQGFKRDFKQLTTRYYTATQIILLTIYLSIYLSVYLSIYLSIYLSLYIYIYIYMLSGVGPLPSPSSHDFPPHPLLLCGLGVCHTCPHPLPHACPVRKAAVCAVVSRA